SPTRPRGLPARPPVDVAAATRPRPSRATAPTVSPGASPARLQRWRAAAVTSASGATSASPCWRARSAAARAPPHPPPPPTLASLVLAVARQARRLGPPRAGPHGARAQAGSFHHRGAELARPVLGEHRPEAGVEVRIFLQHADRGAHGIERAAARREHRPP